MTQPDAQCTNPPTYKTKFSSLHCSHLERIRYVMIGRQGHMTHQPSYGKRSGNIAGKMDSHTTARFWLTQAPCATKKVLPLLDISLSARGICLSASKI